MNIEVGKYGEVNVKTNDYWEIFLMRDVKEFNNYIGNISGTRLFVTKHGFSFIFDLR